MAVALSIVTPEGEAFQGEVDGVVLPGAEGDFGVLPDHERFLTPLRIGQIEIKSGSDVSYAAVSGGFADVQADQVTVLAETCELSSDIDVERAERALHQAEEDLKGASGDTERVRIEALESALERARNRLKVGEAKS